LEEDSDEEDDALDAALFIEGTGLHASPQQLTRQSSVAAVSSGVRLLGNPKNSFKIVPKKLSVIF
jgi:hypothetical protein